MNLIEKEQTIVGVGFVLSIWKFAVHALNTQLHFVHEIEMLRKYFCRLIQDEIVVKTKYIVNAEWWQMTRIFFCQPSKHYKKKENKTIQKCRDMKQARQSYFFYYFSSFTNSSNCSLDALTSQIADIKSPEFRRNYNCAEHTNLDSSAVKYWIIRMARELGNFHLTNNTKIE